MSSSSELRQRNVTEAHGEVERLERTEEVKEEPLKTEETVETPEAADPTATTDEVAELEALVKDNLTLEPPSKEGVVEPPRTEEAPGVPEVTDQTQPATEAEVKDVPILKSTEKEDGEETVKGEGRSETTKADDATHLTPEAEVEDVPIVESNTMEDAEKTVKVEETHETHETIVATPSKTEAEVEDVPVVKSNKIEDVEKTTAAEERSETPEANDVTQPETEGSDAPIVESNETEDVEPSVEPEETSETPESVDATQPTTEAETETEGSLLQSFMTLVEMHQAVETAPVVEPERPPRTSGSSRAFKWLFWLVPIMFVVFAIKYPEVFPSNKSKILTKEQLAVYDGSNGLPLYVAILGEVYDVTNGEKYYGKGRGYHCFVATDGTRAYITGEFVKDLTDDVSDFNAEKHGGLTEWRQFYRDHKEYSFVGLVIGAFYDKHGHPTSALKAVEDGAEQAERIKELRAEAKKLHPNCNSKWAQGKGGEVWCDEGHPRLTVEFFPGAAEKKRCACFMETDYSNQKQLYENCHPEATRCIIPPKEKKE